MTDNQPPLTHVQRLLQKYKEDPPPGDEPLFISNDMLTNARLLDIQETLDRIEAKTAERDSPHSTD